MTAFPPHPPLSLALLCKPAGGCSVQPGGAKKGEDRVQSRRRQDQLSKPPRPL